MTLQPDLNRKPKKSLKCMYCVLILFLFLIQVAAASGSRDISPNTSPPNGQVGAFYFDAGDRSQVWINLNPQMEPGLDPVQLNFTVTFPGTKLDSVPKSVDVRASSYDAKFPYRVRQPVLRFRLGETDKIDLTAPGKEFHYFASCVDCPMDTVIAPIAFDKLRRVAESKDVGVDALGFALRLRPADLQSLRKFIEIISHGIQIR
jgi:hypothetical protein